ncbi:MAG: GNAT family N-acetyltransferase [Desulfobacterales bacterium]|nr:GNAT family N-acetyltransferase [Desulfobacterales bacterium]
MLKIRYFEESDKQEIISLLQAIFPKYGVDGFVHFWEWHYLSNPNNYGLNPAILVSELDHKIVGILAGIRSKLKVGNSILDCLWLADYGTHPDFRFKAGAFKLAHRAMEDFDILLGLGNPNSSIIAERIGFSYFSVPVLTNVLSLENILSGKVKQSWLTQGAQILWRAFKRIYLFACRPKEGRFRIEEVSFFDERFNSLWDRINGDCPVTCVRDKDYLQWRYGDVPGYKYKIFGATSADGLAGYIVLRVEKRSKLKTGLITDLISLGNNSEATECLIKQALSYFDEESVDVVKCLRPGIAGYDHALKKLGFFFYRRTVNVFVKSKSEKVDQRFLQQRNNWFLSIGDSDLDFYGFY